MKTIVFQRQISVGEIWCYGQASLSIDIRLYMYIYTYIWNIDKIIIVNIDIIAHIHILYITFDIKISTNTKLNEQVLQVKIFKNLIVFVKKIVCILFLPLVFAFNNTVQ